MLKRVVVTAVPCLLLLSGCGVAGTEFHPGVAAEVGDRTVSTDRVDELTSAYCGAVEEQITAGGQSIPLAGFRTGIAAQLAMESAVDQLAQEYGVEPSDDYRAQLNQITTSAADFSGEEKDAYIDVQASQPYVVDLLTQIGKIELADEGEEDPTVDFQQARGQDELAAWAAREGFTFDPRYGLELVEGVPQATDTDVTYAAGDIAQAAKADGDPDPNYVASLPLSATCG